MSDVTDPILDLLEEVEAYAATALEQEFDRNWLRSLRQQAAFGYRRLDLELAELKPRARLLEIGGGPFLLAMLLAARGFSVHVLEPKGTGFEQLYRIQDMVLSFCAHKGIQFEVIDQKVEEFSSNDRFDLAYSVNVFEHLDDIEKALSSVVAVLSNNGVLRILCANYSFPYEPHFGVPIVVNKKTTQALFSSRIDKKETAKRSPGLWQSLNFISVPMLRRLCAQHGWNVDFDRSATVDILKRFQFDESLRQRHAPLAPLVDLALKVGIGRVISALPSATQPYLDARIIR